MRTAPLPTQSLPPFTVSTFHASTPRPADAGEPHPNDYSGDPLQADVKQLLTGTYPASSAQVWVLCTRAWVLGVG